ncbi:PAS domain S-box protein [Lutibacter sp.]|uniref:PAS domain S-box protein n=1 Tax=Lutibacter sp. TaxID=1925666 RepID=UPI0027362033|nr:PAS domain S-box protein [Lutibacter sp.]MDP3312431.1 PAS domain S-box protein [Lutibacter sp.]
MTKIKTSISTKNLLSFPFNLFKKKGLSVYQFSLILIVSASILSILIVSTAWVMSESNGVQKEISLLKEKNLENKEEKLKEEVLRLISYIEYTKHDTIRYSQEQLKDRVLRYFESIRFGNDGYVFVNTYSGNALLFNGKKLEEPIRMSDLKQPSGLNLFETEMNLVKLPGGGSFQYEFMKMDDPKPYPKISYIMGFDQWEWILGAGDYLDNLDSEIALMEKDLKSNLYRGLLIGIGIFIPLLILLLLFSTYVAKLIQNQFNNFVNIIKNSPLENKDQLPFNQIYIRDLKTIGIDILQAETLVKQFGNIIDQLNTKIYIFSKVNLKFIHANKGAIQKGGYAISELQDKTFLDILPTINRNQFLRQAEPLLQNQSDKILFESIFQRKDKTTVPVEVQLTLSFFDKKEVYVALIYDITERKQANKLIKNQKEQYDSLVQNIPVGVYKFRMKTSEEMSFEYISPRMCEMAGITEKDAYLDYMNVFKTVHPDEFENFINLILATFHNPKLFEWEGRVVIKDKIKWFSVRSNPSIVENGDILWDGVVTDITEHKKAEQLLQESEQRFVTFMNNTSALAWIKDENLNYVFLNKAYENMQNIKLENIKGKDDFIIFGQEIAERLQQNDRFVLETNQLLETDETVVDYKGTIFHALVNKFPIQTESGKKFVGGMAIDMTEHKKAEQLLQESEIHFRQLFENNPQPMWIYDLETLQFKDVNETALKKYGYAKDEFLTMTLKDIRPQEDIASLLKNIESVTDEFQESGVWRHQLKDGKLILVEIFSHNLLFEGKPARLVLVNDVTERKQTEEEILTINKELKTLNEIIMASVSSINLKEMLDTVLDEALQICGLEGGTICLIEPDNTFKLISQRESSEETIIDLTENKIKVGDCLCGSCVQDNCPLILNTKEEVLKYATREVLRGEDIRFHAAFPLISKGIGLGVLCVFTRTDIKPIPRSLKILETLSSQVALFIENILLVQDLENKVKERTLELEKSEKALLNMVDDLNIKQNQLATSNKKLAEINKEMETFSYSVSHDLKAPLRGIDGYSNLLQELYASELNEEAKIFVNNIRSGTQQMNQIIEDLLAYSRLDHSLIKKSFLNINLFINNSINLYKKELDDFKFEVQINIPTILIVADLDGLSIAFRNIFENAIKFTKLVENPKIIIDFEEDKNFWHILVTDNGIGFDMKYYDKVFQIFKRLHRVEEYPGTGIGLAMVEKAMQRMDGRVWATSELGKGATFYLEIPKILNYES